MTYYILLKGDSVDDIWDNNILGEESFGTFYTLIVANGPDLNVSTGFLNDGTILGRAARWYIISTGSI